MNAAGPTPKKFIVTALSRISIRMDEPPRASAAFAAPAPAPAVPVSRRSRTPSSARISQTRRGGKSLADRPQWDDTPLRPRPPALRGLASTGSEPWSRDEIVYNRRFRMWSEYDGYFDLAERSPYAPTRVLLTEQKQVSYMDRWQDKFKVRIKTRAESFLILGRVVYPLSPVAILCHTSSQIETSDVSEYDGNPFT